MGKFADRRAETADRARLVAQAHGGQVLSPSWEKNDESIEVTCKEGHVWSTTAYRVIQGDWCKVCFHRELAALRRHRSVEKFRSFVGSQGGEILSPDYERADQRLTVRCHQGHTYAVKPVDAVYLQSGCPTCREESRRARASLRRQPSSTVASRAETTAAKVLDRLAQTAKAAGLVLLDVEFVAKRPYAQLLCPRHDHTFRRREDQLRTGFRCPVCRREDALGVARARTLLVASQHAASKGGRLVSSEVPAGVTKLTWQCAQGHQWSADPRAVLGTPRTWCPVCARVQQALNRTPKVANTRRAGLLVQAKAIASARGGVCLTDVYRSSAEGLQFQCGRGHQFRLSFRKLRRQWCEQCSAARHSRGEQVTRGLLEQYLGVPLPPGRPEWLVSDKRRRLSLDGYNQESNLGFEYQGEGVHRGGRASGRYSNLEKLHRTQELDRQKVARSLEVGFRLLVVSGFEKRMTMGEMEGAVRGVLEAAGVDFDRELKADWSRIQIHRDDLRDRLTAALAKHDLRLLTPLVANVFSPIELECPKHGIRWMTTPTAVLHRGRLCPQCTNGKRRRVQRAVGK